jgi:catechol 2,3-dioxygenase-like lactoylglutathione lyase family enzyme
VIFGAHLISFSPDADADREFVRDVLGFDSQDGGGGGLIFALPPVELAFHPGAPETPSELFLMCDDLAVEMAALDAKGVVCTPVGEQSWGTWTKISLPSGGEIGLYEPKHPSPITKLRS